MVSFKKSQAEENTKSRGKALKEAHAFMDKKLFRLKRRMEGRMRKRRDRPITPQGTYDVIHDYLRDRNLLPLFKVTLSGKKVIVKVNEKARRGKRR